MLTEPALGIAAFVVDGVGVRARDVRSAPRMRCASVLKPLMFWACADTAPFASDRAAWGALARAAVTRSENDPATELWSRVGGQQVLANIQARTGIDWRAENGGDHAWRRVLITAPELAQGYAALAADAGASAAQLRAWMREVPVEQTFGVRRVACDTLDVANERVGVKCGWYAIVRAHAVALVELPGRSIGAAVTTFRPQDTAGCDAYAAVQSAGVSEVLAADDSFLGSFLRSGIRRGLQVATSL